MGPGAKAEPEGGKELLPSWRFIAPMFIMGKLSYCDLYSPFICAQPARTLLNRRKSTLLQCWRPTWNGGQGGLRWQAGADPGRKPKPAVRHTCLPDQCP